MSELTSVHINIGRIAAFLGILQGTAWFILSCICIVVYSTNSPPKSGSYMNLFNIKVFHFYLNKNAKLPPGTLVTSTVFLVFMSIYVVLNTAWIVISVFQLSVLRKNNINIPILFKDWSLVTLLISLEDFILVVLIGSDYSEHCLDDLGEEICTNTLIPVLVIVAKGFVLWILNVTIAWLLLKTAKTLRKGRSYKGTFGGIIPRSGYVEPFFTIPRATVSAEPNLNSEHMSNISLDRNYWSVNLRTAMDNRTPPTSPLTPYTKTRGFF